MERTDIAARLVLAHITDLYGPIKAERDLKGKSVEGAVWMLIELASSRVTGNKGHRWLGYAQSMLVANDYLTLAESKNINKVASEQEHHNG